MDGWEMSGRHENQGVVWGLGGRMVLTEFGRFLR